MEPLIGAETCPLVRPGTDEEPQHVEEVNRDAGE
jgi:hypothetical protein